jgi:hypothetical protein
MHTILTHFNITIGRNIIYNINRYFFAIKTIVAKTFELLNSDR